MRARHKSTIRILLATLILLLAVTAVYTGFVSKSSKVVRTFDANSGEFDVTLSIPEGKVWEDIRNHYNRPTGAEYAFSLVNLGDSKMVDWVVVVELDGDFEVDSSWNGDFQIDGNTITFTPDSDINFINGHQERPFGAVLYSHGIREIASYKVMGRMPLDFGVMPLTYVLLFMYIMWFVYLGAYLLSHAKIEKMQKQRRHDVMILDQSIRTFTSFIDAKDSYTRNHSIRVAIYAKEIGRRLGFDDEELQNIYYSTLLHDVGKIGIPDEILGNEGILNAKEYEIIKTHPMKGVEMLKDFTSIPNISDCAHYHHERFDGNGYPEGLKGDEIPLNARITTIADSYDVMSIDRSYQKALSNDKILAELKGNAGSQFDPNIVPIMIDMINDGFTDKIRKKYGPSTF